MSAPRSGSDRHIVLRLPRHTLKVAVIAFGVGVLLFVLIWATGRKNDFYKASPIQSAAQPSGEIDALPAPLAAGDGASDMPDTKPDAPVEDVPQSTETAPLAPSSPAPATETATAETAAPAPASSNLAPGNRPLPISGQMPPPRYPPAALRRGDRGTVVVRVEVDANGAPNGVALVRRSGSRDLDRAAMEAVRRWRFKPAQNNGQAVPASIEIPFDFKPG